MNLDAYFATGTSIVLGSHTFQPDEIKAFARKHDPLPFHVDEAAARASVFGGLCASGWHTAATWMKYNIAKGVGVVDWDGPGPVPVLGPSPGFRNLKWLKPVRSGETVRFTRTCLAHRPVASRPGWRLLTIRAEAFDSTGDKVIEFENSVLVQVQ